MAIVRTPLLSFGASGKLAKTLVFFGWKGLDVAREYVVPTNPRTAAQTTQRTLFTDMVAAWRNYFTNAAMRAAWDLSASVSKKAQSGFNAAMSAMIQIGSGDPNCSFALDGISTSTEHVVFGMLNVDDGTTGDEAGTFEVWLGTEATSLLLLESVAIAAGDVTTGDLGATDDIVYVKLRKDGQDRSGICKVTLVA